MDINLTGCQKMMKKPGKKVAVAISPDVLIRFRAFCRSRDLIMGRTLSVILAAFMDEQEETP